MTNLKAFGISIGILFLIFFICFIGINIVMKIIVGHGNEVIVPELVDMDFNVAVKTCKGLKLYIEQKDFIHSDEIEKGRIISQEPHPNIKTKKFRTIKVTVSEGPEMVRIPYLDNLNVPEAKLKLENAGLLLGEKKYRYSDVVEKDRIIYSQPMADALIARKSNVDVVISLGKLNSKTTKTDKWKNLLDEDD